MPYNVYPLLIFRNLSENIFQGIVECDGIRKCAQGRSKKGELYLAYLRKSTSLGRHLGFPSSSSQRGN